MIDKYLNQILTMDILADSISIIDKDGIIRYFRVYRAENVPYVSTSLIGKHFMTAFPGIDPQKSTILKALRGQASYNVPALYSDIDGNNYETLETIYPIVLGSEVIGAVCIAKAKEINKKAISLNTVKLTDEPSAGLDELVGNSPEINYIKMQIAKIAPTNASVLIYGETGTGKELVARAIHRHSRRASKSFYSQNCAAIPSSLLESMFFGTEKGIYTGAVTRAGILEQAEGGTVFLDEVNSLDISIQAKLLKALEEKKLRRLGSSTEISTDFRIIAAINEEPFYCISSGKIREDLFFRLGSTIIEIPPLRKRKSDIPILVDHFINQSNESTSAQIADVDENARQCLYDYDWPGNVRELKNAIETAIIFSNDGIIRKNVLPNYILERQRNPVSAAPSNNVSHASAANSVYDKSADFSAISSPINSNVNGDPSDLPSNLLTGLSLAEIEREVIRQHLLQQSNHTEIAKQLGITRQTLIAKIKKYGL